MPNSTSWEKNLILNSRSVWELTKIKMKTKVITKNKVSLSPHLKFSKKYIFNQKNHNSGIFTIFLAAEEEDQVAELESGEIADEDEEQYYDKTSSFFDKIS